MNWLTNVFRPKIKGLGQRRDTAETLWQKCGSCGEMIFHRDFEANQRVCPSCGHHMKIGAAERFQALFDEGRFTELQLPDVPADPLHFRDRERYTDKLKENRAKTDQKDAVRVAVGAIDGVEAVLAIQSFSFMGGSLGTAAGEAIIAAARAAVDRGLPLVIVVASGGARMQEGILSLMQLPRTTIAVEEVKEAGLPYIVVLTDPTSGGVTASYAMLGDIHIAEPGAMIAFSGPRVIEQTIRERLPDGFQRAEYLLDHGMVDMVVHRHHLKETLGRVLRILMTPLALKNAAANGSAREPSHVGPVVPSPSEDQPATGLHDG